MVVYASLFGVGAPEALVIGVVALLVFGPKGLAEVSLIEGYATLPPCRFVGRSLNDFAYEIVARGVFAV